MPRFDKFGADWLKKGLHGKFGGKDAVVELKYVLNEAGEFVVEAVGDKFSKKALKSAQKEAMKALKNKDWVNKAIDRLRKMANSEYADKIPEGKKLLESHIDALTKIGEKLE